MTNKGSGNNLQSKYDFNSTWADRIAHLIVFGLVIEIAAVFILQKHLLEASLTIVANILIALGVWDELWFARRAKEAGDGIVAEANERAANAELETQRLKAQFSGSILPEQAQQIVVAIRDKQHA
jgi:hypothetical protein